MIEVARKYLASGLCPLPAKPTKAPDVATWTRYQRERPTEIELDTWFASGARVRLGIVCGAVSGGVETLDLDQKHTMRDLAKEIEQAVREFAPGVWERLPIERTPSGGLHLYFRSEKPEGNLKLARCETGGVIAETRGEGGFIVASPTDGYVMLQGSLLEIPLLTAEERDGVLAAARSLDESPALDSRPTGKHGSELTPLDDFDARGDAPEILRRCGWGIGSEKPDGSRMVRRPGKEDKGWSGTWNRGGRRKLCVFSTSTPFAVSPSTHGPAAIYATLKCGGDFSRTASELRRHGFGGASTTPAQVRGEPPAIDGTEPAAACDLLTRAIAAEVDPMNPPPADLPIFYISERLASTSSNITAISGRAKTAKSTVTGAMQAACIVADGLAGADVDTLGIRSEPPNGKAVFAIDTEQSPSHSTEQLRRTLARAGLPPRSKPDWLHVYPLAGWPARDLVAVLPALLENAARIHGGIHAVFIDGGADFAADVNSPEEASALCTAWHALAIKYRCAFVIIIHSNESRQSDDIARGWLGKQLRRKAESNLTLKRDGDVIVLYGEDGQRHAPILERDGPRFAWDNALGMHRSCESIGATREAAHVAELRDLADEVLGAERMRYADILTAIEKARRVAAKTAEKRFSAMKKAGLIKKDAFGFWSVGGEANQAAA